MIGPLRIRPRPRADAYRIDLREGDVRAIEVVEDSDHVRLTVYDDEHQAIPLIAARLSRNERRRLVAALVGVDVVST